MSNFKTRGCHSQIFTGSMWVSDNQLKSDSLSHRSLNAVLQTTGFSHQYRTNHNHSAITWQLHHTELPTEQRYQYKLTIIVNYLLIKTNEIN